jgi:hypothetical protein
MAEPQRWRDVQQHVSPKDFTDERRVMLAERYWDHQRDLGEPEFNEFIGTLEDPELAALAAEMVAAVESLDVQQTLGDVLGHWQSTRRRKTESELAARLRRTSQSTPEADQIDLLRQLQERVREPDMKRIIATSGS